MARIKNVFRLFSRMQPLSDLSYIDVKNASNPANLLHEWVEEARRCGKPPFVMTLATATK